MNSACLAHDDVCNFKVGEEREELRMVNVAKENEQPGGFVSMLTLKEMYDKQ